MLAGGALKPPGRIGMAFRHVGLDHRQKADVAQSMRLPRSNFQIVHAEPLSLRVKAKGMMTPQGRSGAQDARSTVCGDSAIGPTSSARHRHGRSIRSPSRRLRGPRIRSRLRLDPRPSLEPPPEVAGADPASADPLDVDAVHCPAAEPRT